jgi:hypothetical protein
MLIEKHPPGGRRRFVPTGLVLLHSRVSSILQGFICSSSDLSCQTVSKLEGQETTLSRHSQVGEVCLPRTLKRPLPATPGPSLASQPPPRGCHRVGATPGSLVRLIHRTPHVQDRRLRHRATRQGRCHTDGGNRRKIALKCEISPGSAGRMTADTASKRGLTAV